MPTSMVRVSEMMTKDVIDSITQDASVADAARRMKELKRGCLVVIAHGQPLGIITERDLVQRVMAEMRSPEDTKVSQVMSSPLITVGPEALLTDAAAIMLNNRIRRLPVIEGMQVVGILTVTDFARFMHRKSGQDPMLAAMARAAILLAKT
jgi:signal-transduction protein with cAMP-binding, CBS, and nucleotidyltransferase domain